MKLASLVQGIPILKALGEPNPEISGVGYDSRKIQAGQVFVALKGAHSDGHSFLNEVAQKGALVLVVEDLKLIPKDYKGTVLQVKDTRRALDKLAHSFFGKPSENLFVAGVTGTNGKTTTTYMIEAILNKGVGPTGVLGTIDFHLGTWSRPSTHTTPEPLELHGLLAQWIKNGARAVAMEVSSHALTQGRVDSVAFDAAVFTNLTRDHLDFHKSFENYRAAKASLFNELLEKSAKTLRRAVVNGEDPSALFMKGPTVPTWTYGIQKGDIYARHLQVSLEGSSFEAVTPLGTFPVRLQMVGRHNVANALGAIGVALHREIPFVMIAQALEQLNGVRGRLQRVQSKSSTRVFVDYAHTDDALEKVLSFLKGLMKDEGPGAAKNRLITVFGCGGDRDKGKRPLMLQAALKYSDLVVVTSDNPRTEDPGLIIRDIFCDTGGVAPKNVLEDIDRHKAIEIALREAKAGDVVLIAGKGHEDYQIIGKEKKPFDDAIVAKEILDP